MDEGDVFFVFFYLYLFSCFKEGYVFDVVDCFIYFDYNNVVVFGYFFYVFFDFVGYVWYDLDSGFEVFFFMFFFDDCRIDFFGGYVVVEV